MNIRSGIRRIAPAGLLLAAVTAGANELSTFRTLEDGFGPLMVRSESPVQALRLTPMPRSPIIPKPGQSEFRLMSNVSTIWGQGPGYFLDLHLADTRAAVLRGLARNWAVEMAINERRVVNAHLDGFVVDFHDAFGIDQNGRDTVPLNDTRISFPDYGIELDESDRGVFSRAVELTVIRKVTNQQGRRPALAVSLTVRHEILDDSPLQSRATDYSLDLNFGKRLGRGFIYSNFGYTRFGSDRFLTLPLQDEQLTAMFAYEWRTGVRQALVVQYLYGDGVAVGLGELSEPSHEVLFGYKWLLKKAIWEVALTENIINFENSPDFGLTVALSYRL